MTGLPQIIARLLPASLRWLTARGYVEDDGTGAAKITPRGYVYFAGIMKR